MEKSIPDNVLSVYNKLSESGFRTFFVGGCVRNILMEKPVKDWDMTTNAEPQQIQEVFP